MEMITTPRIKANTVVIIRWWAAATIDQINAPPSGISASNNHGIYRASICTYVMPGSRTPSPSTFTLTRNSFISSRGIPYQSLVWFV
jgi:hypothetical protein